MKEGRVRVKEIERPKEKHIRNEISHQQNNKPPLQPFCRMSEHISAFTSGKIVSSDYGPNAHAIASDAGS